MKTATETGSNPLLHLNISAELDQKGSVSDITMRQCSLVSDLNLDIDPDNLSFLIAVGDVTGASQPLAVSRISCIGQLAILWLDLNHWLVLPPVQSGLSVSQALTMTFGQDISLKSDDNALRADLTEAAVRYLLESDNTAEMHCEADQRLKDSMQRLIAEGVTIQSLSEQAEYDILLRQACVDRLSQWLTQSQDAGQVVNA
ncbi:hypothetical protein [Oceanospirillum sediminis]|uniref:Uncharacterized protein n=1 Tax=Oceanospirillum sediminis TaxID=2760088 RepID=A0A839IIA5_9GAMM|nr:hypothetical protein [Oceanospirillum sediminis]MBB1485053.1 hypothetical protein [Oceanospirillum sediminis]